MDGRRWHGPGGGRYVWRHLGEIKVSVGSHHVDLTVNRGMLDAVLFASDSAFDPAKAELPEPVENPVLRGLRAYRDDQHLSDASGTLGFVVGRVTPYAEVRYDWLPQQEDLVDRIGLWGSAGQYVAGTFAVRALEPLEGLRATTPDERERGGDAPLSSDLGAKWRVGGSTLPPSASADHHPKLTSGKAGRCPHLD